MIKHWKEFEDEIRMLYLNKHCSLKEVQSYMRAKHDFSASIRSYRGKLDEWGCKRRDIKVQKRTTKERSTDHGLANGSITAVRSLEDLQTPLNSQVPRPRTTSSPLHPQNICDASSNKFSRHILPECDDSNSKDNETGNDMVVFGAPWHTMTPDVNTRDARGRTKLHLEAKFGTIGSFNDVLGQVTDIDAVVRSQDYCGDTPLHMALWAKTPNHSIVKLLLASGSDVNTKNREGYMPFHILFLRAPVGGITIHHPDLLLAFLENGADVSIPTPSDSLPFEIFLNDYFNNSMSSGTSAVNHPVFEAFLSKGGNANIKMQSGEYVLNQYLRCVIPKRPEIDKCWEIAKLLCRHADVNQVGTNGNFPIHEAVMNVQHRSHSELVSILLTQGADPNQFNASRELPLISFLSASPEPSEIVSIISMFGKMGVASLHLRSVFFTVLRLYKGDLRRKLIRLILLMEGDSVWSDSLGDLNKWWIAWHSACLQRSDWIRARSCLQEGIPALSLNTDIREVVISSANEILALRCLNKAKEDIQALGTDITSQEALSEYARKEDALRERCDSVFAMLADFREKSILGPDLWCDLLLQIYTLRPGPRL